MAIYRAGTLASDIDSSEETIVTYVENNPGKTMAEIKAANSGIDGTLVEFIISLWNSLGAVVSRRDANGDTVYISSGDWGAAIYTQRANARKWLIGTTPFVGTADGKSIATMVSDFASAAITITYAEATELFQMLKLEGSAEIR